MDLKVYTAVWCRDCREAKRFLTTHNLPFKEIDIENTPGAAELVIAKTGKRAIPQFVIDGTAQPQSLFDMIRRSTEVSPDGVLSAYRDNADVHGARERRGLCRPGPGPGGVAADSPVPVGDRTGPGARRGRPGPWWH